MDPAERRAGAVRPPDPSDRPARPFRSGTRERVEPAFTAGAAVPGERRVSGGRGGGGSARGRRPRSWLMRLVSWGIVLGVWAGIGLVGLVAFYARELPPIDQLAIPKRPPNIAILAADGTVLANRGDTGGAAMRLSDLPPYLPKAFVAIEDRRFYHHIGIDPYGIARAVVRNVIGGGATQGGSTLTQQLAKNLFLTQERTVSRKIQEAILALWLEHRYTKAQILELYLNRVYFGAGAYGVEAAAQKYFGRSAKAVTLPEAAVLAGLMKAPTKLAPNHNPQGATERAAQVLTAMADEAMITPAAAKAALAAPAHAVQPREGGGVNYAADYVMDVLDDTIGAIDGDIVVTTTIDPAMESAAERALADELATKGTKFGASQGALVALDPSGAIKALIGGRSYADSQFDRATAAKRQPGSAFKPFVYLSALEHGLTPDSVREDAPINVKGWQPENYARDYQGPVTLTRALAQSLNTVAVRLGLEVGPRAVVSTAHRLGIVSELQPNASLALGTSEVSPLELAAAYVPFANGGIGAQSHIILKVRSTDGRLLYQRKGSGFGRVVDAAAVGMMNTMLRQVVLDGTGRKADLPGWVVAGKTGTSQDWRDAWFVGYTGALVADVWVGNDDGSPTRKASGGGLPIAVWNRFMQTALRTAAPVPPPGIAAVAPSAPEPAAPPAEVVSRGAPPTTLGAVLATLVKPPSGPAPTRAPAGPMTINASGQSLADRPPAPLRRAEDTLLPPGSIPERPTGEGSAPERGLLERLFGG